MTLLRIDCDASWSTVTWDPTRPQSQCFSGDVVDAIPVTPRALLWSPEPCSTPNALASALLTFLQLPVQHLRGTAYLTGLTGDPVRPGPLTPAQIRAFTSALQVLHAMPDFLALHAQAGRIAATWFCPTLDGSFP
jgi:hypothetical protein